MEILNAAFKDAPAILALQKLAFQSQVELYNEPNLPPMRETQDEIERCFQSHLILKAVEGGVLIGSVRGRGDGNTCHVERLIVHPDHQRRGIGTQLMQHLEDQFPSCCRFELFTGHKSVRSIGLYRKLGYTIFTTGVKADHVPLVFMEKHT